MNWQAISFDWNQVRTFLATVEEGSFSGAARALKSTQPTVGRQISELESTLGVTLFERSVRGPTLTEAGDDLLGHVRAMGDAATLISMAAEGHSLDVSGARSLLVSHWYVDSHATVSLITKAFEALKRNPKMGRAGAMRTAMLSLILDDDRAWHPAYWAPFVVVGQAAG